MVEAVAAPETFYKSVIWRWRETAIFTCCFWNVTGLFEFVLYGACENVIAYYLSCVQQPIRNVSVILDRPTRTD